MVPAIIKSSLDLYKTIKTIQVILSKFSWDKLGGGLCIGAEGTSGGRGTIGAEGNSGFWGRETKDGEDQGQRKTRGSGVGKRDTERTRCRRELGDQGWRGPGVEGTSEGRGTIGTEGSRGGEDQG